MVFSVKPTKTPVFVLTGFLGSGKTTLARAVLKDERFKRTLIIVNEMASMGVDQLLLDGADAKPVLLDNGCICCELRGAVEELLVEMQMKLARGEIDGFDRVLLETSGMTDPTPIIRGLLSDAAVRQSYTLSRVVAIVDPTNSAGLAAALSVAERQVSQADAVIVSKRDVATELEVKSATAWAHSLNAVAEIEVSSLHEPNLDLLCADRITPRLYRTSYARSAPSDQGAYLGSFAPAHAPEISSATVLFDAAPSERHLSAFVSVLARIKGADLLRVKGAVRYLEMPETLWILQGVGDMPLTAEKATDQASDCPLFLVVIAKSLNQSEVDGLWLSIHNIKTAAPVEP